MSLHPKYPDSYFGPDNATGYVIGRFYRHPNGGVTFASEGFMLWGDAQNALRNCVPPETAVQKGLVRSQDYEERPDVIHLAVDFIEHCNDVTAPVAFHGRTFDGSEKLEEVVTPKLAKSQEAAFNNACNVLNNHFMAALLADATEDGDDDDDDQ